MSIWPGLWRRLLPQDCMLCGNGPTADLLCPACATDLPRLPMARCPVCAAESPGGGLCGTCQKSLPGFDSTHAAFPYAFPVDKLVQALKYQHRLPVAGFLATAMLGTGRPPDGDLLLPLPLSRERLRERGFNQALEIARGLAGATGLPLKADGCRRIRHTQPQAVLPWQERQRNVRRAFECDLSLHGLSVIVIDDVMTSGATLEEFARTLKAHGAARVHNWVACRAQRGPG